jgi:hypothetical protein
VGIALDIPLIREIQGRELRGGPGDSRESADLRGKGKGSGAKPAARIAWRGGTVARNPAVFVGKAYEGGRQGPATLPTPRITAHLEFRPEQANRQTSAPVGQPVSNSFQEGSAYRAVERAQRGELELGCKGRSFLSCLPVAAGSRSFE